MPRPTRDLSGTRFGRLVVKERAENNKRNQARWLCKCDCGKEKIIDADKLRFTEESTKSCGCYRCEIVLNRSITHGAAKKINGKYTNLTYSTWISMRNRCNNTTYNRYCDYGGRGITICDNWNQFQNFYNDMGERPVGMTLERIDNNKGYFKENCRWATPKEQRINQRRRPQDHQIIYDGTVYTAASLSRKLGMSRAAIIKKFAARRDYDPDHTSDEVWK